MIEPATRATRAAHDADSLDDALRARTSEGTLVERTDDGQFRCIACAHRCVMHEGRTGSCGVRFVRDGALRVPHGYVARKYIRPVETNTIYHVRPGARSLTFGMFGCDLRCAYCHNWRLSQSLRDGSSDERPLDVSARDVVAHALAERCEVVCAAYNEPMIAAEWAHAIFTEAKREGLVTALVSDGNTTPEALAHMRDVTDVYRIDLKGYSNEHYKSLGGRIAPVLDAIAEAKRLGYWVEVVTLVVPDFNDNPRGLREIADRIASVDPDIPWHLNAFVPRYRLDRHRRTPAIDLVAAAGAAYARGLRFVYVSNLPDQVQELGHTRCPSCHTTLVERVDYRTRANHLVDGACPTCAMRIPGLFGESPALPFDAPMLSDEEMP
jgi:pyruvate formate lyase activating enzyme